MEIDHAAACRFFSPGDAARLALEAYRAAASSLIPPPGVPWFIDGQSYADASVFADAFAGELAARLGLLALDRLGAFMPPSDRFDPYAIAGQVEPEKMRHVIADRETEIMQDMADFCGQPANELHGGDNRPHNASQEGAKTHGNA